MHFPRLARCWTKRGSRIIADSYAHRRQASRALLPDLKYSEDLFNFTRGRFVCNEQHELAQRHVRFNVNELARCAAEVIGAKTCINISKYPDGMYNKSMLLTMNDGSRVVAKVPNPNAGLPHFTTASEVATMDFARNILKMPVPKVLAWCSQAHESPVGVEYIIMERVPGVELEHVWPKLNIKDRFAIVRAIAGFQKAWTSVSFTQYGSLYFSKDLDHTHSDQPLYIDEKRNCITSAEYAIGPSTGRETFDNGRGTVDFDRGPWNHVEAYHIAIGDREMACVSQLTELPKSPITLCSPGTYQPTKAKKLKALHCYHSILKRLIPEDKDLSSAHLWHDDLHLSNIFVDPAEPTKVVGVIDWQSTEISPLYFHACQPHIIDYVGSPVNGLERPKPRDDLNTLEPSVRQAADALYLQQSLCSLYNTLTHRQNPKLYAALQFQRTQEYLLLLLARNILIDGEVTYLSQVAEMQSTWKDSLDNTSNSACGLSETDRKILELDLEGVERGMEAMRGNTRQPGRSVPRARHCRARPVR